MIRENLPKYCRQRSRTADRAYVELGGHRVYLGTYDSPDSREQYRRVLAEWLASGSRRAPSAAPISVVELAARFLEHATTYYRKPDGTQTSEVDNFKQAIRPLRDLYGRTLAADFGPLTLKVVRADMLRRDWSRSHINKQVGRIKMIFRWGVENEMVPPSVYQGLLAVAGLKRGRTQAREAEPVRPAPDSMIEAVQPHVSRQVWALVQLQLLTGARPGELVDMRPVDIDAAGTVWVYRPEHHKTAHHGHSRQILLGPQAQAILQPFLADRPADGYCFSPAEAEAERRTKAHAARTTPLICGNVPGSNRVQQPERPPRDRYSVDSYRRAIVRACNRAFPPPGDLVQREDETGEQYAARLDDERKMQLRQWRKAHTWHPHQLRHNVATRLRQDHGIDMAQTILGHRLGSSITEIYAEANINKAIQIMAGTG